VNLNAKQSNVVTTGPASINPDRGKPYGMSFPVVSIKDFVRVQKALIDSLGIKKLKAVVGLSMGGLQAYEWAQSYPESVERIIPMVRDRNRRTAPDRLDGSLGAAYPARPQMEQRRLLWERVSA
jgi:homoserine acetyltransferase